MDLLEVRDDIDDMDEEYYEEENNILNDPADIDYEYTDDEEDPMKERITKENKFKELDEVLEVYKH